MSINRRRHVPMMMGKANEREDDYMCVNIWIKYLRVLFWLRDFFAVLLNPQRIFGVFQANIRRIQFGQAEDWTEQCWNKKRVEILRKLFDDKPISRNELVHVLTVVSFLLGCLIRRPAIDQRRSGSTKVSFCKLKFIRLLS